MSKWKILDILFTTLCFGAGGSIAVCALEGRSLLPSILLTICFFVVAVYASMRVRKVEGKG